MPQRSWQPREVDRAADIVRHAGGTIIGRTRLQKIAYLLELADLGDGFMFQYRHYGPYSEDLASALRVAEIFGALTEEEKRASWGGYYSVYTSDAPASQAPAEAREALIRAGVKASPIELELCATAAYLAREGDRDPWDKTRRLKPEKAGKGRIERAKDLYEKLRAIPTPRPLPDLESEMQG